MSGLFQGLELGKRALLSHQYNLSTIGHNIANANTPGFTRQRVNLTTGNPLGTRVGQMGSGVRIASVTQIRDSFLTAQYRQGSDQLGRWSQLNMAMQEVESVFLEPSATGFNSMLNDFFGTWQTLSQNPESSAARATVREQAILVANGFRQLSNRLDDLQRSLNKEVESRVGSINRIASELSQLNHQVARHELAGDHANDLRDRRGLLVDELSRYVDVNVIEESSGIARVFIGSMELVERASYTEVSTSTLSAGTQTRTTLTWRGTSADVKFSGGELSGLVEARDDLVNQYRSDLDDLAKAFVAQVNSLHTAGYGLDGISGRNFFAPNPANAADIAVDSAIMTDLNNIAASTSGGPGDNANALNIGNLQYSLTMNNGASTFNEFFAEIVGTVGVRAAEAADATDNATLILQQVEFQRASIQGVSLDEEMANLIKAQHAYEAAARVISTMDRALDTLINDMGVGR